MYSTRPPMPDWLRKSLHVGFIIVSIALLWFINIFFGGRGCQLFDFQEDEPRILVQRRSGQTSPGGDRSHSVDQTKRRDAGDSLPLESPAVTHGEAFKPQGTSWASSITFSAVDERVFTLFAAMNVCGYDRDSTTLHHVRNSVRESIFGKIRKGRVPSYDKLLDYFAGKKIHLASVSTCTMKDLLDFALTLEPAPSLKRTEMTPDRGWRGLEILLADFHREAGLADLWQSNTAKMVSVATGYRAMLEKSIEPVIRCLAVPDSFPPTVISSNLLGEHEFSHVVTIEGKVIIFFGSRVPSRSVETINGLRNALLQSLVTPFMSTVRRNLDDSAELYDSARREGGKATKCSDWPDIARDSLVTAIDIHCLGTTRSADALVTSAMQDGLILTRYFYQGLQQYPDSGLAFWSFLTSWTDRLPSQIAHIKDSLPSKSSRR